MGLAAAAGAAAGAAAAAGDAAAAGEAAVAGDAPAAGAAAAGDAAAGAWVGFAAAGASVGFAAGAAVGEGDGALVQAEIKPTREAPPARLAATRKKRRRLTEAAVEVDGVWSDTRCTSARTGHVVKGLTKHTMRHHGRAVAMTGRQDQRHIGFAPRSSPGTSRPDSSR